MAKFQIRIFIFLLFTTIIFWGCSSDDDAKPSENVRISILDLSVTEGDVDKNVFIRLQLNASSDQLITAFISSKEITAAPGSDFVSFENIPIAFQAGQSIKDQQITIKGDDEFENDEIFEIEIVTIEGNATIDRSKAQITIVNDDEAPVTEVEIPQIGYTTPDTYPNMTLIWQDEFSTSEVNSSNWTFELGNGNNGWGNNELQFYKSENARTQDGFLIIEAKKETSGPLYTSSRMITKSKFDFKYGRVDIRAALPTGQGIWPALWMLGSNFSSVGWPSCGEIDIMEIVGHEPNRCHGTVHWSNAGQHAQYGDFIDASTSLHDNFNVYSIIWTENEIRWLLNDVQYNSINTSPSELDEFRENFFFIFNVAVGGNWPGSPNSSTMFPQRMIVDYIRVFQ